MATQKKDITTYERDKDKVKISGDADSIKDLIERDQKNDMRRWLFLKLIGIVAGIGIVIMVPKEEVIPVLIKWMNHILPFLIFFVVVVDWAQILLSG